jgi:two-component system, response regulator PdtaR
MSTASTAPTASHPTQPASPPSLGRILVVDDDRLVLATVAHGLSQAGYEVIDADNGDDAILLAREHRPQLALLDIRMEGMSGFEVAQTLRDAYAIPFMFLSAFADEATLARVHELGAMAYLIKPLDVGQIVPSVEAVFARLRSSAAAQISAGVPPAEVALPVAASSSAASSKTSLDFSDPVPLAVGVLMHRHSLPRAQAFARLQRLAHEHQRSVAAQAERLLSAIEELAGTAI